MDGALHVQPRRVRDRARHRGVEQQHADLEQHHGTGSISLDEVFARGVHEARCRLKDKKGRFGAGEISIVLRFEWAKAQAHAPPQMMPPQQMMSPQQMMPPQQMMSPQQMMPPRQMMPPPAHVGFYGQPPPRNAPGASSSRIWASAPSPATTRLPPSSARRADAPTSRRVRPTVGVRPAATAPRSERGLPGPPQRRGLVSELTTRRGERVRQPQDSIRISALHVTHARASRAPRS